MVVCYAVKFNDGSYLDVGCDSITFDRNDMQLFSTESKVKQLVNKKRIIVDNETCFIVKIDEQSLIHSNVSEHGII